jgi:sulfur-oxidizing protein SoxX
MPRHTLILFAAGAGTSALVALSTLAGCAALSPDVKSASASVSAPSEPDYAALTRQMMATSFTSEGIATVDRLTQDDADAACSQSAGQPLAQARAHAIEAENLKTVQPPADGRYLGDWKAGEKLAQSGKGMTWTDTSTAPADNGGSCYNCHQLSAAEISYGTLGPSLYHYAQAHGVADPASPAAQPVVAYTWNKLYNAKAYNACSNMPRFGHKGLLDERQLKDLMALLLDPKSPVNQ